MLLRTGRYWFLLIALAMSPSSYAEDAKQFVQRAVKTELAADRDDHSRWIYFETDRKPDHEVKQWVAETHDGSLRRVIEINGQPISEADQRQKMDGYLVDRGARSKQRKSEQHDDVQATEMLTLLPEAFIWTNQGARGDLTLLHFRPNPEFHPPDFEARVFAVMEGDMAVDTRQLRIASLKGRLIRDVKIAGGLLGALDAGGTFDVERRQTAKSIWQITESHIHIQGHALIFKTISEQEDDVKTNFTQLPGETSLEQAEAKLLAAGEEVNQASAHPPH
ncbi:MAG TPA: hypothetical protein VFD98_14645 [Terracidiphilus sp.]|jgi:hypothetical protein|nr:hypothetical protein [Terracidiphilus sp.]